MRVESARSGSAEDVNFMVFVSESGQARRRETRDANKRGGGEVA